jgi:hypothetical protein
VERVTAGSGFRFEVSMAVPIKMAVYCIRPGKEGSSSLKSSVYTYTASHTITQHSKVPRGDFPLSTQRTKKVHRDPNVVLTWPSLQQSAAARGEDRLAKSTSKQVLWKSHALLTCAAS